MIRAAIIASALASAVMATSAVAQGVMTDAIMTTAANASRGPSERCLDGLGEPTPQQAARFTSEAEPAFRRYLELAAAGMDLSPAFTNRSFDRRWAIDGEEHDFAIVRDPWAAQVARLELIGLRLGGMRVRGRALWRAFAADGTELGIYDGLFRRRTRGFEVSSLDLFSPGFAKPPLALTGFCYTPGDTEAFREARAQREAERAARRAAREAERAARRGGR